jgi:hypothetical protein
MWEDRLNPNDNNSLTTILLNALFRYNEVPNNEE